MGKYKYKRIAGIYAITNKLNSKIYIGYSESILVRWNNHKDRLRRNTSHCVHLQSAWNVYGESSFDFSIVEVLPGGLTKEEYEIVETKWVLFYKSHLSEFGYNGVLPGTIPLKKEGENVTSQNRGGSLKEYMCINMITKEVIKCIGIKEVESLTGIFFNHIWEIADYWKKTDVHLTFTDCHSKFRKSRKGWMIVDIDLYDPEFDYINFKKHKLSSPIKKTWRDYPSCQYIKKTPEEIIPHEDRNLKRVSVIAVDILTGEEKEYRMLKDCYKEFDRMKVYKCINNSFGKYKHRGYYFKRATIIRDTLK